MKKLALALAFAQAMMGGCLVMDSATILVPACVNGSCQTGPGITTGDQLLAAMAYQFEVQGHNACKAQTPLKGGSIKVELSFYDKSNVRIGLGYVTVASLPSLEKFRHTYIVPPDVLGSGTPATIKVRSITEIPVMN